MSHEDYSPRQNDHLVEPMFAGLGVEGDEDEARDDGDFAEREARTERPGLWRRIWTWLAG